MEFLLWENAGLNQQFFIQSILTKERATSNETLSIFLNLIILILNLDYPTAFLISCAAVSSIPSIAVKSLSSAAFIPSAERNPL